MKALGGAVMVHVWPAQENAGKIVRAPIAFPWVLEVAAERLAFEKLPREKSFQRTCDERDPQMRKRSLVKRDVRDLILSTVRPVLVYDTERGLREAGSKVRRNVDLEDPLSLEDPW